MAKNRYDRENAGQQRAGSGAARGMVRSNDPRDNVRRGQENVRPEVIRSVKRSIKENAEIWAILSKH